MFVDCQNFASQCGRCFVVDLFIAFSVDIVSWVTNLLHYNAGQLITLLNVRGDVNWWFRVTHEIHGH